MRSFRLALLALALSAFAACSDATGPSHDTVCKDGTVIGTGTCP